MVRWSLSRRLLRGDQVVHLVSPLADIARALRAVDSSIRLHYDAPVGNAHSAIMAHAALICRGDGELLASCLWAVSAWGMEKPFDRAIVAAIDGVEKMAAYLEKPAMSKPA